jgi:serine/threonine-protein kinase
MPRSFGKYELLGELGAGGMATVYKARDTLLDRVVALKVISQRLQGGEAARKRFLHEARVAAVLNHPNIVAVYELGIEDGFPFIAMEYLPGQDLRDLIEDRRPLSLRQKLNIALQISRALEHAHSRGVIHRDIKPGNIRVLEGGGAKLMDFGIARLTGAELTRLTRTGAVMGTAAYMAPEQLRSEPLSAGADVFAFGIVMYELLSYSKPFDAPNPAAMVYRILNTEPEPLAESIPEPLRELVAFCLQKSVEARAPDFSGIVRELTRIRRELRAAGQGEERTDEPVLEELPGLEPTPRLGSQRLAETGPSLFGVDLSASDAKHTRRRAGLVSAVALLALVGSALGLSLRTQWLGNWPWTQGLQSAPVPTAPPPVRAQTPSESAAGTTPTREAEPGPSVLDPEPPPERTPEVAAKLHTPTAIPSLSPARSPTVRLAAHPTPPPAATAAPAPATAPEPAEPRAPAPVRLVRLGGAPEGTQICVDGRRWSATRGGLAWILDDVPTGERRIELFHRRKGTARKSVTIEAGADPQVVLFQDAGWTSPSYHIAVPGSGPAVTVREHRRVAEPTWSPYHPPLTVECGRDGLCHLEADIEEEFRVDLGGGKIVEIGFQWIGKGFEAGELRLEHGAGMLSTKRCLWRWIENGCGFGASLDCGVLN